ncbi:hypothetical protein [Nonomuraea typhae]|uniref:Phosphoribosyl-ATP diphosphatase n=1 Tax=Nonomuraea typhae TaxID=2603600 RepID=A0ABW7YJD6_9ACTN
MPDDVNTDELVELVTQLSSVETLWALACLFASADDDEQVVITGRVVKEGERVPGAYDPMAALTEWHQAISQNSFIELSEKGRSDLAVLRTDLIHEEAEEVSSELKAIWSMTGDFSRARLAAELADLLYVAYGTAQLFEIDLPAVFELVHEFNMRKVDPETGKVRRREDGKVLKPEGFKSLTKEDIEAVIN